MSLIHLSKVKNNDWYIGIHHYPYGKKGYESKKFSPTAKTMRKCEELSFYSTLLPILHDKKHNMWRFFDKQYTLFRIVNIVIQKSPADLEKSTIMRRVRALS